MNSITTAKMMEAYKGLPNIIYRTLFKISVSSLIMYLTVSGCYGISENSYLTNSLMANSVRLAISLFRSSGYSYILF